MENETLHRYCDEVESALDAIRGELLVYQQDPDSIPRFAGHAEKIGGLCGAQEMCEETGFEQAMSSLHSQLSGLSSLAGRIPGENVRSVLDRISDIESKIALVRMSDDGFSEDLDRLLDDSLGLLQGSAGLFAVPDKVDSSPTEEAGFEIDNELLDIFAAEARELLGNIESNLQRLVSDPENKEALWEIRRSAHTFKGSSGLVGITEASRLAHRIEDLLDDLSTDSARSHNGIIPVLFSATDCLRELTYGNRTPALERVLAEIHADLDRVSGSEPRRDTEPAKPHPASTAPEQPQPSPVSSHTAKPIVRVPLEQLEALVDLVRDLVVNRSVIGQRFTEFDQQVDELHNTARRLRSITDRLEVDVNSALSDAADVIHSGTFPAFSRKVQDRSSDHFHSLEIDRYTELHESIRDLTETAADTASIDQAVESVKDQIGALLLQQRRLFDEVQSRVMSMRVVAFDTLKTRLERAVRMTCDDEKKNAALTLVNGGVEIDTQMLDEIVEPLVHLLKNAVVHGIETPETRRLLGKSDVGQIVVRVDNEDTHITLTVSDDGGGVSLADLKARAISSGAIDREAAARLESSEALDLIFRAGLTTARRLNLNAGRGIGMNIVKESIEANGGTVSVTSEPNRGTRFSIRLPLKLAVTNALLIRSIGGIYAVPLKHIERIAEIPNEELRSSDSGTTWESFGREYSLRRLDDALGLCAPNAEDAAFTTALLMKGPAPKLAVGVAGVIRTEEIVIKPVPKPLDGIREVIGIAFLSSGELAPILDLPYLLKDHKKTATDRETAAPAKTNKSFIMVVDDSPSVRHMTSKVIRNAGWGVITAKDGLDALELLRGSGKMPDLILTDIEMPRMGGFELAEAVRNDPTLNAIPLVVITSRSAEKHRQKAEENGVAAYLVKPYEESELIRLVHRITTEARKRISATVPAT